jgi:hypothetical protein
MKKFDVVRKEVEGILVKSPLTYEKTHSKLTLKWVLVLEPNASEALRIAAIAHDIDRAVTGITEKDLKDFSKLNEFKKEHSIRSAKAVVDLLKRHHYDKRVIGRAKGIIEKHEFGGDKESDVLKDADSISYFDYNLPFYLKRNGKEKTKKKIKFMYVRLSKKARAIVNQIRFKDKSIDRLVKGTISGIRD